MTTDSRTVPLLEIDADMLESFALLQSINASNNGYLFAPTGGQLACANRYPELFRVVGETIYKAHDERNTDVAASLRNALTARRETSIEYYGDGYVDWEGMILAQQERRNYE